MNLRREGLRAPAYAGILLWVNLYLCRDLFTASTAFTNSMQGFWAALGHLGDGWLHSTWWPYWDCGIPFEFTYAPLVPALTRVIAAWRGVPHLMALESVTAIFYCLAPVTLFLMCWRLTRAADYSFAAALSYSLLSPTGIIIPDGSWSLAGLWSARRLYLQVVWDDTPHCAGLALLPLIILFLALSITKRRTVYYAAAAVSIALAALASTFSIVVTLAAAVCLLAVVRREVWRSNAALVAGIGLFAYALAAPFLPPSLIQAIRAASAASDPGLNTMRASTALAVLVLGWAILWGYLPRRTKDWRFQFFALFAYIMSSIPMMDAWLHRNFLPQPGRYKIEMEMALAVLIVFALGAWFKRLPRLMKALLIFLGLSLAGEQIVSHRRYAKDLLQPRDMTATIEYRTAQWASRNLPGVRVAMPGSIAQWTNASTGIMQFSGGSWSVAYSQTQQNALKALYNGDAAPDRDGRVSLAWMRAYGVGAVAVSGPQSKETWKPFAHPDKFEGVLPAIWKEDGVTLYRIPQRTQSLAHVVPEVALVLRQPRRPGDIDDLERYDAALENASLPEATLRWAGWNRINIDTVAAPGQAISLQVSYHPGWHASINGGPVEVRRDGLGLMWLRPAFNGACRVDLYYDGGWELRLCRYLSLAAILTLLFAAARRVCLHVASRSSATG
jgi:hypothetical protein